VDKTGGGIGVVDYVMDMDRLPVYGIAASGRADEPQKYINTRAELWFRMKDWVERSADIPENSKDLCNQLRTMEYFYDRARGRLQLTSKEQLRSVGIPSPDEADALSLTFALPSLSAPARWDDDHARNVYNQPRDGADSITGY
jgi:hypothetical protein